MIETFIAILSEISRFVHLEAALGFLIIIYLLIRLGRRKRQIAPGSVGSVPADIMEKAAFDDGDAYGTDAHGVSDSTTIDDEFDREDVYLDDDLPPEPGEAHVRRVEKNVGSDTVARSPEPEPAPAATDKTAVLPETALIPETRPPRGLFERLKSGLSKTRQNFSRRFESILSRNGAMDEDALEAVEEALITADVGVPTTMELMRRISEQSHRIKDAEEFKAFLRQEMRSFLDLPQSEPPAAKPYVIMMVGVNGAGKTTSIGKLAARYAAEGKKVLLAAADTFRAAAADQLAIWAERTGADIVRHRDNADPAAVAYDGIEAAISRGADVVIVDTAGRLQTKVNLMEQLKKIKRSIDKALPGAPHEVMLTLDATTGQNAVSQAMLFNEGIGITGIIITKLDGTAKGGIVIGICQTLKIPIRYIGIGESLDDLQAFEPQRFIDALL